MTANEAQRLIRYTGWASRKVLSAALQVPLEELERPNAVSHGSIAGTLAHIYLADRVWLERITQANVPLVWDASLSEAAEAWPGIQQGWEGWADSVTDAELDRSVSYKSIAGNVGQNKAGEIVTHVVNHATLHRGQVVGMLRQLGIKPPATDFIYYLREL
ncbi:MAG: DinB family protein [Bryobacteraceae bacterium]